MATVFEKFNNPNRDTANYSRMNLEEIVDAIYCICNAIEHGIFYQAAPENLEIQEDGTVYVSGEVENLYYVAPENIMSYENVVDKESGWFTLGLLMYFMIYGRSYYEDNDINFVLLSDMMREKGNSLIKKEDTITRTHREEISELLKISMEKLTSWEREKRVEGVGLLLKAMKEYSAFAEILYIFNDQIVYRENKQIETGKSVAIYEGDSLVGMDGKNYKVKEKHSLQYRPGTHTYSIFVEVCDSESTFLEKYLFIEDYDTGYKGKLMRLKQSEQMVRIAVNRTSKTTFGFSVVISDPVQKAVVDAKNVYHVDIPAGMRGEESLLQITYKQDLSQRNATRYLCEVALYNREGTRQISDNIMRFFV